MTIKPTVSLLVSAVAAVSVLGIYIWRANRRKKVFEKVGRVKQLTFYPVRELPGVEVNEVQCTGRSIEYDGLRDRAYVLVSDNGNLLNVKDEPSLVLLKMLLSGKDLTISSSSGDPLKLTLHYTISPEDKTVVCKIEVIYPELKRRKHFKEGFEYMKAVDCGDAAAKWFQSYLKRSDVRLMRLVQETSSQSSAKSCKVIEKDDGGLPIQYRDLAPVHLATQESLDELNAKLEKEVSERNFRPNVLVEGCTKFAEDEWKYIKFSSGAEIYNFLPCGRCFITTVDRATGEKGNEPLKSLRKFRLAQDQKLSKRINHAPCFGIKCDAETPGNIRVGDEVFAVVEKDLFQYMDKS